MSRKPPAHTIQHLQSRCDYWIGRLRLEEWRGRVRVHHKAPAWIKKYSGSEAVGCCSWSTAECSANIYLRETEGEDTLLHEILHIHLQGHATYESCDEMLERAINRLVIALMEELTAQS